jgi:hypothetical protein
MSTQTHISLSRLSPELNDRYGATPGYRKLYSMAQDGRLRTEMVNGRHYVLEANLPAIAADLGLAPTLQASTSAHANRAAVEHAAA